MHKTNIGHFIKRPASPGILGTIILAAAGLTALGLSLLILGQRMIEYSEYLATVNV